MQKGTFASPKGQRIARRALDESIAAETLARRRIAETTNR